MKQTNQTFQVSHEVLPLSASFLRKEKKPLRLFAFTSPEGSLFQITLPIYLLDEFKKSVLVNRTFSMVTLSEPSSKKISKDLMDFLNENIN